MEMSERRNWWVVTAIEVIPSSYKNPILGHEGRNSGTTIETLCNCKFHDIQGRLISTFTLFKLRLCFLDCVK
jgi:hypothetical protein